MNQTQMIIEDELEFLKGLDRTEIVARQLLLEGECAAIGIDLDEMGLSVPTGEYSPEQMEWRKRAEYARLARRVQLNVIRQTLAARKEQERQDKQANAMRFEQLFMKLARELLDAEQYKRILNATHAHYHA